MIAHPPQLMQRRCCSPSRRGFTLTEALAIIAIVVVTVCILVPVLAATREQSRVADCANNLRLLASAGLAHAFDNRGAFFTNDASFQIKSTDKDDLQGKHRWFDSDVIGNYLKGEPLSTDFSRVSIGSRLHKPASYGLGLGTFVCPSDEAGPARSYDMNVWASSFAGKNRIMKNDNDLFFNADADAADRLLLFTDVVGATPTDKGWATSGTFGLYPTNSPGVLFGGTMRYFDKGFAAVLHRFEDTVSIATDIDYVRHGKNENRSIPVGAVNIALADASVRLYRHDQLYSRDPDARQRGPQSTYEVLWSPADIAGESVLPARNTP